MSNTTALPFHLSGNYAPVTEEVTELDLEVVGELPTELCGRYVRTGPNPASGTSGHWFLGDGMVHGVALDEGRARWYRNRYVQTSQLVHGATTVRDDGTRDFTASTANTNVVRHAGRTLVLEEASFPYELDDELGTTGVYDFDGRLTTAMTAHPKVCPTTGELHFFGYGFTAPLLTYHVADAAGRLVTSREVDVPGSTMMHDVNLTERFVVFMDLPAVFDLELALTGTMPYRFDPAYGARLGVLRRDDPHGEVRWFDLDPCYAFHAPNAHDDGRAITIDVVRYRGLWDDDDPGLLWRWTIDLVAGTVTERQLDDRPCEFPRVDDRQVSLDARRGWVANLPGAGDAHGGGSITRYDLHDEGSDTLALGPGRVPGEPVFAPAGPEAGGPGWLVTFVYDAAADRSELIVVDADDLQAGPVARVLLPVRVPYGFHGAWLAD